MDRCRKWHSLFYLTLSLLVEIEILLNLIITLRYGTVLLKKVKQKKKFLLQTFGKPQIAPRDLDLREQWFLISI